MLRGVLLHVIKAAGPVNSAVDGTGGNFGRRVVNYVVGVARIGGFRPRGDVWRVNNFDYLDIT
jgi:hypothetical protein